MGALRSPAQPRRHAGPAAGACAVALIAGMLLAACGGPVSPAPTARSFLAGWARRDWAGMRRLVASPPANFTAVNSAAITDIGVRKASYLAGKLAVNGTRASEPVTERLEIDGIGTVTIGTVLHLVQRSGKWLVRWSPATIAPGLRPGGRLSLHTSWPPRAPILGAGGVPITASLPRVTIGVEGQRIKNATSLAAALVAAGATRQAASTAIKAAKARPTWFEPVFTVPLARYERIKPALYPVPGTVFQTADSRAAITADLTAHVVGSVGPITAAELRALGAPYTAQSIIGQSGLELAGERQLAGLPGATVTVLAPDGKQAATLATIKPRPGEPVRTTIDPVVQRAAEAALAGESKSAALVAVNAATGALLASVVVPLSSGFDQALAGAFPPGSSFKVITSTALIERGLKPTSPASCPPTITVDGKVFHNAEGITPAGDLLRAFAESCNTAFIGLATRHLSAPDLPATAATFGIGTTPKMGLPAFGGSVPRPVDEADLAATAIGQGRVLVSPLDMAMVAAAVDTGTVRRPRLVDGAPDDTAPLRYLPRTVIAGLHQMMAQVVASGTAAGQGLPAGTFAKTGTAQYGSGNPLPTDAWLVGFNGDVAFAMVVVNGGEGGPTDGPLVAKFLRLLHASGR
jgi:cell division protein FtsI/penicillin-binding protein 2